MSSLDGESYAHTTPLMWLKSLKKTHVVLLTALVYLIDDD